MSVDLYDRMRAALATLVGASEPGELRALKEALMHLPVPAEEAPSITNAIDVLIEAAETTRQIGEVLAIEGSVGGFSFSVTAEGVELAAPAVRPVEFAYSVNEESFYNDLHPTREDALVAAQARFPDADTIWTARKQTIDYTQLVDAGNLEEDMQCTLGDLCGEASEDWGIAPELRPRLEALIVAFLERENGPITCWSVEDVEQHQVVASK